MREVSINYDKRVVGVNCRSSGRSDGQHQLYRWHGRHHPGDVIVDVPILGSRRAADAAQLVPALPWLPGERRLCVRHSRQHAQHRRPDSSQHDLSEGRKFDMLNTVHRTAGRGSVVVVGS